MRRSLMLATLLLACAAVAQGCFLEGGAFDVTGSGGTGGSPTTSTGGNGNTTGSGGSGGAEVVCGDGEIGSGEKCDDANITVGDGCDANCQIESGYACSGKPSVCEEICGDGVIKAGVEECDDANAKPGDGCSDCQIEDGYICDGDSNSICIVACGNGVLDNDPQNQETCDDANAAAGDGCEMCIRQPGWDCGGTPSACVPHCGDAMVVGNELCDDGAGGGCKDDCTGANPGYTCNASGCATDCGDGLVLGNEACDDGNENSGDGCSSACAFEATCGNGVVEPGEVCDGGSGCMNCTAIDPTKTCGQAVVITPAAPGAGGLITTTVQGDTTDMPPPANEILQASCANAKKPKLLTYTTGPTGSFFTFETKAGTVDGLPTFGDTVAWAYHDCPGKADEELCNDDIVKIGEGTPNYYSRVTVGYLPPKTTLFIVVAGASDANAGKFILELREQPVKLLFSQTFAQNINGLTASDVGGDQKTWAFCDGGGSCGANSTSSHSGNGYALADDNGNLNGETLGVNGLPVADLQKAFVQYNYDFSHKGGASDSFICNHAVDGGASSELFNTGTSSSKGRKIHDVSAAIGSAASYAVQFKYTDGGNGNFAKLDDLFIYGY